MRKYITLLALLLTTVSTLAQGAFQLSVISTNLATTATCENYWFRGRANIKTIQVGAVAGLVTVALYDSMSNATPSWGTNSFTTTNITWKSYPSNAIPSSFVSAEGFTNWYTNQGIYTVYTTNGIQTNVLTPSWIGVVQPNTVATFNVDILLQFGAVLVCNTNASVVFYYNGGN